MAKKILVTDDDPGSLRLMAYALQHEGYEVVTATNGRDGLKKAFKEKPDLVILDVMLPGIDGFEVCHRLRAEPETARLPVLMLSAKVQETDRATGLRVGANDYLTKPWNRAELMAKIAAMLAGKGDDLPSGQAQGEESGRR